MIRTRFASVHPFHWGCLVRFDDGTEVPAEHFPSDPHYIAAAHRYGYDGDTLAYCREHEVAHLIASEAIYSAPSPVLWGLAHGAPLSPVEAAGEELIAQALQGFVRANQRPFVNVPWDAMKARFLEVLS